MRKLTASITNTPVKPDEYGYNYGVLQSIEFEEKIINDRLHRDHNQINYIACKMIVEVEGVVKPMELRTYSGSKINNRPTDTLYKNKPRDQQIDIYNRFTTILLQLNILTIPDLEHLDDKTIDHVNNKLELLNKTKPKLKFKIVRDQNNMFTFDIHSLEIIAEKIVKKKKKKIVKTNKKSKVGIEKNEDDSISLKPEK